MMYKLQIRPIKKEKIVPKANLINICESCHQKIHNSEQEFRINKTNNGYQLCEL